MTSNLNALDPLNATVRARLDQALRDHLPDPAASDAPRLAEAMRYAALAGGKRIRPFMVPASADLFNVDPASALRVAAAVEMVHCYSLIHDDLPAMDDDELRRGKPTCHVKFDEATAILAGDALLTKAFEVLSEEDTHADPKVRSELTLALAKAAGEAGMVGGQMIDLAAEGQAFDLARISELQAMKTGALIRAAVQLGALASEQVDDAQLAALGQYAESIGLAFQVQDDILDIESDTSVLGKQQGADVARDKPTYPALLGLDGAHRLADQLRDQALGALAGFGPAAQRLRQLADYIVQRRF